MISIAHNANNDIKPAKGSQVHTTVKKGLHK